MTTEAQTQEQQSEVQAPEQQTQEQQTAEQQQQPHKGPSEGFIRRFGELTAARKAAEGRAAQLEAELARYRKVAADPDAEQQVQQQQVHPNVHQLAEALAERMVTERVQQQTLAEKVKDIETAGKEQFGDEFDRAVMNLQISGIGSPDFLNVLTNLPGAEKVVRYLGDANNIEEALKLAQLPPVQMALEMSKLTAKASKAYSKQLSSAPAPITAITGKGAAEGAEPDPRDTAAWVAWRNKNARRR